MKYKTKYLELKRKLIGGAKPEPYCPLNNNLEVRFNQNPITPCQKLPLSNVQTEPQILFRNIDLFQIQSDQLYTMIMVDPDAPSRDKPTYINVLHWLIINTNQTVIPFKPSAPPVGSGYHRYYFYLFEQKEKIKSELDSSKRLYFDLNKFVTEHNLQQIACIYYETSHD